MPACPPGPFCCRCLCFSLLRSPWRSHERRACFRWTLVASALRTLLGIARTSGELCSVHVSTTSVTLSEMVARVCLRARECVTQRSRLKAQSLLSLPRGGVGVEGGGCSSSSSRKRPAFDVIVIFYSDPDKTFNRQ